MGAVVVTRVRAAVVKEPHAGGMAEREMGEAGTGEDVMAAVAAINAHREWRPRVRDAVARRSR
jgi:hypothetical protein